MATAATARVPVTKKKPWDLFARIGVISIIPALIYGFPLVLMFSGGEFVTMTGVIRKQSESVHDVLYGPAYSDPSPQFKVASLIERRPDVLALGTSRILQVRQQFFRPGARFYNAGLAVRYAGEFDRVLDAIPPGQEPRVILVSIDQYLLNPNFPEEPLLNYKVQPASVSEAVHSAAEIFLGSWKRFYEDAGTGKLSLKRLLEPHHAIGIRAIMEESGYRNDGSGCSGTDEFISRSDRFSDVDNRIRLGIKRFEPGDQISQERLGQLRVFLEHAKQRGIHVIGFLPPFAPHAYDQMYHSPKYSYLGRLYPALQPAFAEFGFPFLDYSDARSVGGGADDALDGFHCSEKTYLRMFLDMIQHDPTLRQYSNDPAFLANALEQTRSNYYVFPNN
jgi:hypothetical protein